MRTPEEAQSWLASRKDDNWPSKRHTAVAQLPPALRATAYHLLGYDADGKPLPKSQTAFQFYNSPQDNNRWEAMKRLDSLSKNDRLTIFKLLFPTIAPDVEAGWQLQKTLPYHPMIHYRRAFHAPNRTELTTARRLSWLQALFTVVAPYNLDILELAQWTPYISYGHFGHFVGVLLAAVLNRQDQTADELFDLLCQTVQDGAAVGAMGRHVIQALLTASRPEGWQMVEQLLLAAQRQEGLRQVILETVDEAHPQAFRRMVHLIHENNLVRFNSVIRAMDVWLGLGWNAADTRTVKGIVARLDELLQDSAAIPAALESEDPRQIYLGLWAAAYDDAEKAVTAALPLLTHPTADIRLAAVYILAQLGLPEASNALVPRLLDEDLRVAAAALLPAQLTEDEQTFEVLEQALPRFPQKEKTLSVSFWPWLKLTAHRTKVADALAMTLHKRPLSRIEPYFAQMSPRQRSWLIKRIQEAYQQGDPAAGPLLLQLLGDRSQWVRQNAVEAVAEIGVRPDEAPALEALLNRKTADLRRGVLRLLLNQEAVALAASIERLMVDGDRRRREAGLELLRQFQVQQPDSDLARKLIRDFAPELAGSPSANNGETRPETATLADGLGLFDPVGRTPPVKPKAGRRWLGKKVRFHSPAAAAVITSLNSLVDEHATKPVIYTDWRGQESETLLGNLHLNFPLARLQDDEAPFQLPLKGLWEEWWRERPSALRDDDGLEILRALAIPVIVPNHLYHHHLTEKWYQKLFHNYWGKDQVAYRYPGVMGSILWWLTLSEPLDGAAEFLLDAVEHSLTLLPEKVGQLEEARHNHFWAAWLNLTQQYMRVRPADWKQEHHHRFWTLRRWLDEPHPDAARYRPHFDIVWQAYQAGFATEADVLDHLIGERNKSQHSWYRAGFDSLRQLSGRKPNPNSSQIAAEPEVQSLVQRCRERILAVETQRGDMPTAATAAALSLRYSGGLDSLITTLTALGQDGFLRGWAGYHQSRQSTLSHLIRVTFPKEEDTPQQFAAAAKAARFSEKTLLETAVYAPQWAAHIEYALQWPQLAEAVWWFHAHTKDSNWRVEQDIRDAWNAETAGRTPLTGSELMDGAVDVAWFHRTYRALGNKRWQQLEVAAKYASGGQGHTRARLFSQAMLGEIGRDTLDQRIKAKRYQDAVRALGLLPLPEDGREAEILGRYLLIQEFLRGVKKFGAQRQASEKLAAQIGLENLARTAGFSDPMRLEWAMEREAVADLVAGPVVVTLDAVRLTLSLDEQGRPELTVQKGERPLKNIPTALKKQPEVLALRERKEALLAQSRRTRLSLEQAMCRGDVFTARELQTLLNHPVLRPQLEKLIFIGDYEIGYPVEGGKALLGVGGRRQRLKPETALCLAHPHDLLLTGEWHLWQAECFREGRVQPFKQLFRELYVLTPAEAESKTHSPRYAGHEVHPRQALALFGQRGWVSHPDEGIRKTFHDAGLTAWVNAAGHYGSPADIGGITLENITFTRRGDSQPLSLTEIPPRLFSEVMRDVDLVVSVAHLSGVDPEASMSSVEMRGSLVRETAAMLKLSNVAVEGRHILVNGELNRYSIHLGSGVVHQQPGGYVCIVPVHNQQRGRIFLPFADDDPKSAEILAKVVLLARDRQIKDPTILEQILPRKGSKHI